MLDRSKFGLYKIHVSFCSSFLWFQKPPWCVLLDSTCYQGLNCASNFLGCYHPQILSPFQFYFSFKSLIFMHFDPFSPRVLKLLSSCILCQIGERDFSIMTNKIACIWLISHLTNAIWKTWYLMWKFRKFAFLGFKIVKRDKHWLSYACISWIHSLSCNVLIPNRLVLVFGCYISVGKLPNGS